MTLSSHAAIRPRSRAHACLQGAASGGRPHAVRGRGRQRAPEPRAPRRVHRRPGDVPGARAAPQHTMASPHHICSCRPARCSGINVTCTHTYTFCFPLLFFFRGEERVGCSCTYLGLAPVAAPCWYGSPATTLLPCSPRGRGRGVVQVEISRSYGLNEWRDDLKALCRKAGAANKPCMFLFTDSQVGRVRRARGASGGGPWRVPRINAPLVRGRV